MSKQPFEMDIEELLINAIERRNAASCHEIVRRKIEARRSLLNFLQDEIDEKITDIIENTDREAHQFLPPRHETSTQPDIDETLKWVGKAIQGVAIDESDNPDEISRLARECLSFDPPFKGITMDAPDKAEKYILMAAGKPNVMSELPPRGLSFWRAAAIAFMNWRDMQKGMKHLRREG
jgi:hypothetical protein